MAPLKYCCHACPICAVRAHCAYCRNFDQAYRGRHFPLPIIFGLNPPFMQAIGIALVDVEFVHTLDLFNAEQQVSEPQMLSFWESNGGAWGSDLEWGTGGGWGSNGGGWQASSRWSIGAIASDWPAYDLGDAEEVDGGEDQGMLIRPQAVEPST
ncbi:hypothetical protein C8R44DRAFT_889894 [Mycena epipterygia]|nr:hypothetical protein C8R44DRAFT_889894 [Mycena epipterygia]